MQSIANKLGWALAGIISLLVVAAAATIVQGGPLDPTNPPGPTMKTLDQIEPRTPISSIPFTISQPGSYYLTRNLTIVGSGDGITISSDNVTLDLNGFTLDGAGIGRDGITTSVNHQGLMVRNGNAQNWTGRGFFLDGSSSVVLQDVQARGNAVGIEVTGTVLSRCTATSNTQKGIFAASSDVSDCKAVGSPIGIQLSSSTLRDCRVGSSSDTGIDVLRSVVQGCQLESNRWGIVVQEASNVHHNTVHSSGSDGIRVVGGGGGSTIADNNVSFSGASVLANGIWVESNNNRIVRNNTVSANSGGIGVAGSFNTIDDNSALTNISTGFSIGGTKNTVIRNSATGNPNNYSIGAGNNPGPVVGAASATNPLSNTQ